MNVRTENTFVTDLFLSNFSSIQEAVRRCSMWLPSPSCPRPCSPTTHKATSSPPCTPSSCLWAEHGHCPSACSTVPSLPVPDPGTQILTKVLNLSLKWSLNIKSCPLKATLRSSLFLHRKSGHKRKKTCVLLSPWSTNRSLSFRTI